MIRFAAIVMTSFVVMEFVLYLAHRYVYHGFLWVLHKSHHRPRKGPFELNNLFPVFFAAASTTIMFKGLSDSGANDILAMSIGITMYGGMYFFIHDLNVHRRLKILSIRIPFLIKVKKAHAIHHREGGEPYGLLLFGDLARVEKVHVREEEDV